MGLKREKLKILTLVKTCKPCYITLKQPFEKKLCKNRQNNWGISKKILSYWKKFLVCSTKEGKTFVSFFFNTWKAVFGLSAFRQSFCFCFSRSYILCCKSKKFWAGAKQFGLYQHFFWTLVKKPISVTKSCFWSSSKLFGLEQIILVLVQIYFGQS